VLSLFVTRAGGGGGCFSVLCARGGGGGGGCFFFELRAYGSPAIMAPYIFGFFEMRASPAIWHPIFWLFLRCAHMGVPRSWHPIFVARAAPSEAEVAFF